MKGHMRFMIMGRIKCGSYWSNIPGYEDRENCSACKKKRNLDIIKMRNIYEQNARTTGKTWTGTPQSSYGKRLPREDGPT